MFRHSMFRRHDCDAHRLTRATVGVLATVSRPVVARKSKSHTDCERERDGERHHDSLRDREWLHRAGTADPGCDRPLQQHHHRGDADRDDSRRHATQSLEQEREEQAGQKCPSDVDEKPDRGDEDVEAVRSERPAAKQRSGGEIESEEEIARPEAETEENAGRRRGDEPSHPDASLNTR